MATVGQCLLFYLKYPAEMERLYEADEPNVEGLPDPDETLERVRLVGDTACREAAELLGRCLPGIEQHFSQISTVKRKRVNLENTWQLSFHVTPKDAVKRRFEIGVITDVDRGALIPWVWSPGGRRAEDELLRILRRGITPADLGREWWSPGSVALAEVEIPVPDRLDEPVACEPLLAQIQQAFASFTAQDVEAIAAIASKWDRTGDALAGDAARADRQS